MLFGILLTSPKPPLNFRKLRRVSEEKKSSRCPTCISEQRKHWTRGQEAKYGLIENIYGKMILKVISLHLEGMVITAQTTAL